MKPIFCSDEHYINAGSLNPALRITEQRKIAETIIHEKYNGRSSYFDVCIMVMDKVECSNDFY